MVLNKCSMLSLFSRSHSKKRVFLPDLNADVDILLYSSVLIVICKKQCTVSFNLRQDIVVRISLA